jgi:hypothetical protein
MAVESKLKNVENQQRQILDLERTNSEKLDRCINLFSAMLRNGNSPQTSGEKKKTCM